MQVFDSRWRRAVVELQDKLPGELVADVGGIVEDGVRDAACRWQQMLSLRPDAPAAGMEQDDPSEGSLRQIGSLAPGFVEGAGAQDDEHPAFHSGIRGPLVQRRLCKLLDESTAAGLKQHFEQAQCAFDVDRLNDLADGGVSHSWLWAISPHHGPIVEEEREFVETIRVRLGAGGPPDVGVRGCCNKAQLDTAGRHASWCSLGEATAAHNAFAWLTFRFRLRSGCSHRLGTRGFGTFSSQGTSC